MSATFSYSEDNGIATGSPAKGTTRTPNVTQANFKSVDDVVTAYTTAPINAGENSFTKYQFGAFSGVFNQISNAKWSHTAGTLPSGVSLYGGVMSTYTTPSQASLGTLTNISNITPADNGLTVLFSIVGPEGANPTSTLTQPGYTQYLVTQLRTTGAAPTGDIPTISTTLKYSEN